MDDVQTMEQVLRSRLVGVDTRERNHVSAISALEAGIPDRLMNFRVAQSENPEWTKIFDQLISITGTGLVSAFVGATGTGKSQMAASLSKYVYHQGRQPVMIEAGDLCASVKDTFGTDDTSRSVFVKYMRPSLLCIDEVNGGMSDFDIKLIQRVVSRRYDTKRSDTILISNETVDEFAKMIGDRVIDRINDTGLLFDFTWKGFRK